MTIKRDTGLEIKRGVKMFSPYAVKAGTAQGEEEGEGIYDAYPYSNLYG
ncbi:MAG TPA: hypothetical protein VFG28_15000 [Syntrophales bacterium]|nr:hypothetical protein [Syntrophales bacterium]